MSLLKILVINDPHVAASPPLGCTSAYVEDVFTLLEETKEIAQKQDVAMTIFTGDLFHHKRNVPHWVVRRVTEILKDWPGTKFAIVGNHDLGEEGIASIERQPIGVLFESGVLEWLDEDILVTYEGVRVQLSPLNYYDEIDLLDENGMAPQYGIVREEDVDWAIKVAHGSLVKDTKKYPQGFNVVPYASVPQEADLVLFGHLHHNSGIKTVGQTTFASLGSLGRVARTDYNKTRRMEVLIVELSSEEMSFLRVPLTKAISPETLFLESHKTELELNEPMIRFARDMAKALSLEDIELTAALEKSLSVEDIDPAVVAVVKKYLEKAGWE